MSDSPPRAEPTEPRSPGVLVPLEPERADAPRSPESSSHRPTGFATRLGSPNGAVVLFENLETQVVPVASEPPKDGDSPRGQIVPHDASDLPGGHLTPVDESDDAVDVVCPLQDLSLIHI